MSPTTVMTGTTDHIKPTTKLAKMDSNNAHDKFGYVGVTTVQATHMTIGLETTRICRTCDRCAAAKAIT